jgi:hypothetical protein
MLSSLPGLKQAKAHSMPCNNCLWFDNDQGRAPGGPDMREQNPKHPLMQYDRNIVLALLLELLKIINEKWINNAMSSLGKWPSFDYQELRSLWYGITAT